MEEKNEFGLFQGFTENYVNVGVQTESDLSNEFVEVAVQEVANRNLAICELISVN